MKNSFTIDNYKELLAQAVNRYHFIGYNEEYGKEDVALWRHDIDISPHRALKLASLESEMGVMSTYFIQLTSYFYSVFEVNIRDVLLEIQSLGHRLGLHFDPMYHNINNEDDLSSGLALEKTTLEGMLDLEIDAFSMHNPTVIKNLHMDNGEYAGMSNASSAKRYSDFEYCSDSNGIWRHRELKDVLKDEKCKKIHILTHPCWWQDTVMSPRDKVLRSIDGRRESVINYYDGLLKVNNRPNVT